MDLSGATWNPESLDGDVYCDAFFPPISAQCGEPVPALGAWGRVGVGLILLGVGAAALNLRNWPARAERSNAR